MVDSRKAMADCLESALAGEGSLTCDLLIFYTGIGHNFRELLSEAHRLSPGARVVGCTCAGTIGKKGPNESLKTLAVMAVKGPASEFAVTGMASVMSIRVITCQLVCMRKRKALFQTGRYNL